MREAEVLKQKITPHKLFPSAGGAETIENLVKPASRDELMRFVLPANYFVSIEDHFADLAKPL